MNIEELRSQARSTLEQTLNQLQAATLLVAELEFQISEAGTTVQNLTLIVEQLVAPSPPSPDQSQTASTAAPTDATNTTSELNE